MYKRRAAAGSLPLRDRALGVLSRSMQTVEGLRRKLTREGYPAAEVDALLSEFVARGFLDDLRFARAKATSAAERRLRGERTAYGELVRAGVAKTTAKSVARDTYAAHDSAAAIAQLLQRKAGSIARLDRDTASRRLTAMLVRRGFAHRDILPAVKQAVAGLPPAPRAPARSRSRIKPSSDKGGRR